eukprot:scaffold7405_cov204-Amphora_coffeaeformis.AAC.13
MKDYGAGQKIEQSFGKTFSQALKDGKIVGLFDCAHCLINFGTNHEITLTRKMTKKMLQKVLAVNCLPNNLLDDIKKSVKKVSPYSQCKAKTGKIFTPKENIEDSMEPQELKQSLESYSETLTKTTGRVPLVLMHLKLLIELDPVKPEFRRYAPAPTYERNSAIIVVAITMKLKDISPNGVTKGDVNVVVAKSACRPVDLQLTPSPKRCHPSKGVCMAVDSWVPYPTIAILLYYTP